MSPSGKRFLYQNGLRYEVTRYGLLYSPARKKQKKKHTCPDCTFCQWCSESRCNLCLREGDDTARPADS